MRLSALGLIGGALLVSAVNVASVSAQTAASISGSTTFITPAGFTSTVSAESVLPSGLFYNTGVGSIVIPAVPNVNVTVSNPAVIVAPSYNVLGFAVATTSLQVATSVAPTAIPAAAGSSFTAAAATVLTNAASARFDTVTNLSGGQEVLDTTTTTGISYSSTNIDFIAAIINAGAGVSGLD
ncbi:MAG: hypothetical protein AUK48_12435 [Oscillatoriales cyanobacterium CG2_30_44_21]|nr:MAG: hypothetical protein AUK48_12435 [Oscillatoriales cyanobacterium CG2_30_44_21]